MLKMIGRGQRPIFIKLPIHPASKILVEVAESPNVLSGGAKVLANDHDIAAVSAHLPKFKATE